MGGYSMLTPEVGLGRICVRLHALVPWLPIGGADFAMLISELKRFEQPQRLVHIAPNWKVVDG